MKLFFYHGKQLSLVAQQIHLQALAFEINNNHYICIPI